MPVPSSYRALHELVIDAADAAAGSCLRLRQAHDRSHLVPEPVFGLEPEAPSSDGVDEHRHVDIGRQPPAMMLQASWASCVGESVFTRHQGPATARLSVERAVAEVVANRMASDRIEARLPARTVTTDGCRVRAPRAGSPSHPA